MKELQEILKKISQFAPGEKAILATVIDVVGSGYRRPGARMLIDEKGYSVGTVSGGCLEADVLERAKKVLETGEPTVITYDTTQDENSVFGLNMGCRGIVRILLESFDRKSVLADNLKISFANRERQFIGTVISSNKNSDIGSRIFFDENGVFDFVNFPEVLRDDEQLKNYCEDFWSNNKSTESLKYKISEDIFELFFENINPPLKLLLFGTGYDALPLINFAKEIGWNIMAIDHRAAFANAERLPEADEIIVSSSEDLSDEIFEDATCVAVIMTHNYERDRNILRRLLHSKCLYIGALGPKNRTEKLLEEIGENHSAEQLQKLYAPVGLDLGAETPEEIALAIIAEIRAVLSGRNGGYLRDRKGSIYGE